MSGYRSGGNPFRLITRSNTAGTTLLNAVSNTPGDGSYGSWSQASASLGADSLVTAVAVVAGSASGNLLGPILVDVGIGGAGSETTLTTVAVGSGSLGGSTTVALGGEGKVAPAVRVTAGQRVAIRAKAAANFDSVGFTIYVFTIPYVNLETV